MALAVQLEMHLGDSQTIHKKLQWVFPHYSNPTLELS